VHRLETYDPTSLSLIVKIDGGSAVKV